MLPALPAPLSPMPLPHAPLPLFHLLRGGWVCLGATGAWDAGGLEIPGLIGLMPCRLEADLHQVRVRN